MEGRPRPADGPVALSLTRQKVPTLDRSELAPASGLERGAYTLWESSDTPELILIATGQRALARARRGPQARRRGHGGPRRLDAVLGAVRRAARRLPRRGAPTGRHREAVDRGGRLARLAAAGSATTATRSRSSTSARRRPAAPCSRSSDSPSTTSPRAHPRFCSGWPSPPRGREEGDDAWPSHVYMS